MKKRIISVCSAFLILTVCVPLSIFTFGAKAASSLYAQVLQRDGFIYGINIPWFSDASYGRNLSENSRDPKLKTAFDKKQVTKIFRNCNAIGFNCLRIRLFEQMEGIAFGENGEITGLYPSFLTNLRTMLEIAKEENVLLDLVVQPSIGKTLSTALYKADKSEYDFKTQMFVNSAVRNQYIKKVVEPLCEAVRSYPDVVMAMEPVCQPENDVYEQNGSPYGTSFDNMAAFAGEVTASIRSRLPNIMISMESAREQVYCYNDLDLDIVGVSKYNNTGEVLPAGSFKSVKPMWLSSFGASSQYNSSNDFQMQYVLSFYNNAMKNGYQGAFYWSYGYMAANADSLSLIDRGTGKLRPAAASIHFNILNRQYERQGFGDVLDKPVLLYIDDLLNIQWIGSRDAYTYTVERSTDNKKWAVIAKELLYYEVDDGSYFCTYSDKTAEDGVDYFYRVTAVSMEGVKAVSESTAPILKKIICPEEENLIKNNGFETGDASQYIVNSKDFSVVQGTANGKTHSGSHAGYMTGATPWKPVSQTVAVKPDTNYTLTAYVRLVAAKDEWGGYLFIRKTDGTPLEPRDVSANLSNYTNSADWQRVTIDFNSGSNSALAFSFVNGGAELYIDDIYLFKAEEQPAPGTGGDDPGGEQPDPGKGIDPAPALDPGHTNLLQNSGFETGDLTGFIKEGGLGEEITVIGVGTEHAAYVKGSIAWKNLWQTVTVRPNTDYVFTAYVHPAKQLTAETNLMKLNARQNVGGALGSVIKAGVVKTASSGWGLHTLEFNSGSNTSVNVTIETMGAELYADNLCLYEKNPTGGGDGGISKAPPIDSGITNLLQNSGFETGDLTGYAKEGGLGDEVTVEELDGEHAAHIAGNIAWKNFWQTKTVKQNTDYVFTAYVYPVKPLSAETSLIKLNVRENSGGNLGASIKYTVAKSSANAWGLYTVEFNSGSRTSVNTALETMGAELYVDNLCLYEKNPTGGGDGGISKAPTIGSGITDLLQNGGFETGDLTGYTKEGGLGTEITVTGLDGEHAAHVAGAVSWKNLFQPVTVKQNTNYVFAAYIYPVNPLSAQTNLLKLSVRQNNGGQLGAYITYAVAKSSVNAWGLYTVEFNSGSFTSVNISIETLGVELYVDNLCLYEK